ncbi:MAG TPA: hypothetical protein VEX18_11040, partial [Polyangiaceae bacterium]|nr:hypothetical protein [Polyangiaceae bacterium]
MNPATTLPASSATQLLEQSSLAPPLKVLLVLTVLALLPAIILTTTSFVRTVVVLSFVRQGVGAMSSPPSQVIIGLSLFLTLFTMSPVVDQIKLVAVDPYMAGKMTDIQAFEAGTVPLKRFM